MIITVILASASPRRIELIKHITDDFEVRPSDADESVSPDTSPEEIPIILSQRKAHDIWASRKDNTVIGCDTVVIADNEVLGKPTDKEDAKRMIRLLAGRKHKVITGVTVIHNGIPMSFADTTEVVFRDITETEIDEYVAQDEPYDKAGAYAVQGIAGKFVEKLIGDYYNVVGFPVKKVRAALESLGIEVKQEQL